MGRALRASALASVVVGMAVVTGCGGKKGSGSAFAPAGTPATGTSPSVGPVNPVSPAPAGPVTPAGPAAPQPIPPTLAATQLRQVTSVVGRTVGKFGTANATTPLPGVGLYCFIDGVRVDTKSNADGFFLFQNVPVFSTTGNGKNGGAATNLTVYVSMDGWELPGNGPNNTLDTFNVDASASSDVGSGYQVDVGEVQFVEAALKVTSSLFHPSLTLASAWLPTGGATAKGYNPDVYLTDPAAAITLTFNRPIDTAYSDGGATDPLIEFYAADGTAVPFAGSWDTTATIYTIKPTAALTVDANDSSNYHIRIARPVRAEFKTSGAMYELRNVDIFFNVVQAKMGALTATQGPTLAPAEDGGTGYVFDSGSVYLQGIMAGTSTPDFIANQSSFYLKWSEVAGAKSYNVYWRDQANNTSGEWTVLSSVTKGAAANYRPDGTYALQVTNLYSAGGLSGDGLLSVGEAVQFIVTSVDADGNESSINAGSPLIVHDTFAPFVASVVNTANDSKTLFAELTQNTTNRSLSLTFNENMDNTSTGAAPALAPLGGLLTGASPSNSRWTSLATWKTDVALTFTRSETQLTADAPKGQNLVSVNMGLTTFRFMINDTVLLIGTDPNNPDNWEYCRITDIDGPNNQLHLAASGIGGGCAGGNLVNDFVNGTNVYLVNSAAVPGLTAVQATVSTAVLSGATSVSLADNRGNRFHKGEAVTFYMKDEDGYIALGCNATVETAAAATLTFALPNGGGPLTCDIPANATVVDANVTASEPEPRAPIAFVMNTNATFTNNNVNATLAVDNFTAAPDTQFNVVTVSDTTGFAVNDVVNIAASTVNTNATTADQAVGTPAVIPMTGHGYEKGDLVVIARERIVQTVAASVFNSAALTFNAAIPVIDTEPVTVTDLARSSTLTQPTAVNSPTVTVSSASGMVQGQTIVLSDGVQADSAALTILSVAGNVITLTANAPAVFAIGSRASRALINVAKTVNGASNTTTVTLNSALSLSPFATLTIDRPEALRTVTAVNANGNDFTVNAAIVPIRRSGTTVRLYSFPESLTVNTVDAVKNQLTFSANLQYPHRTGAAVAKAPQTWVQMNNANWNAIAASVTVSDTIMVDSLGTSVPGRQAYAQSVRIPATVAMVDSPNKRLKLTTNRNGVFIGANQSAFKLFGDGVSVTSAVDTNGNAMSGLLSRVNANAATVAAQ